MRLMGDDHVNKKTDDPLRMMGLIGTLGIEIAAFTVGGVFLGKYLDALYNTKPLWIAICVLVGLAVGIVSALYTLKTFIKD